MKSFLLSLILMFSFSCATSKNNIDQSLIKEDVKIAGTLKANQYKNIYFSAQPKNYHYKKLAADGFKTVINLRHKDEYKENEESWLVKNKYKMNYYNIPFKKEDKLSDELIDKVTSAVKAHSKEGKVLVHCSTGNRVGAWLAAHLHKDHDMSKEESLSTAQKMGLKKEGAIHKVKEYFSK